MTIIMWILGIVFALWMLLCIIGVWVAHSCGSASEDDEEEDSDSSLYKDEN